MITTYVAIAWNQGVDNGYHVDLGSLVLTAGSQHIYEEHYQPSVSVRTSINNGDKMTISTHGYNTPDQLRNDLRCAIDGPRDKIINPFFNDMYGLANK
jgi:hypothetical protein